MRKLNLKFFRILSILFTSTLFVSYAEASSGVQVQKYKQFNLTLNSATSNPPGNPFDAELKAHFKHVETGTTMTAHGYYNGGDTYEIRFMPTLEGTWSYITESDGSPNGEYGVTSLNNQQGSFECVASSLPGRLQKDGRNWVLEESGKAIAPIMIPFGDWWKGQPNSGSARNMIDWVKDEVKGHIIGTTLVYFNIAQDQMAYIEGKEGDEFNLQFWNRMNEKYDYIRDQGLGQYIMMYGDDDQRPSAWGIDEDINLTDGRVSREERLLRYVVARFGSYPMVIFDTGIDVREYRSNSWTEKFTRFMQTNQPYGHFAASRAGADTNTTYHPQASNYYSDGIRKIDESTATSGSLAEKLSASQSITAFTDRFRLGHYDKFPGRDGQNLWKQVHVWGTALTFGSASYLSDYSVDPEERFTGYLGPNSYLNFYGDYDNFNAVPYLRHRSEFFENEIENLKDLRPAMKNVSLTGEPDLEDLLDSGRAILAANKGIEYVAFSILGSSLRINLEGTEGKTLDIRWFDPDSGQFSAPEQRSGGGHQDFNAPSNKDYVLHILVNSEPSVYDCSTAINNYINLYFAHDLEADRDGDSILTTNDITLFIQEYLENCA